MKAIFFLVSTVGPAVLFWANSHNTRRLEKYLDKHGYDPNNPAVRARYRTAGNIGAGIYGFVILLLWKASFTGMRGFDDVFPLTVLWMILAYLVGGLSFRAAFWVFNFGKLDSPIAIGKAGGQFTKRPEPLVAFDEHGSAQHETPEQVGMADPNAMDAPRGEGR